MLLYVYHTIQVPVNSARYTSFVQETIFHPTHFIPETFIENHHTIYIYASRLMPSDKCKYTSIDCTPVQCPHALIADQYKKPSYRSSMPVENHCTSSSKLPLHRGLTEIAFSRSIATCKHNMDRLKTSCIHPKVPGLST